jgi:hypothetical protein
MFWLILKLPAACFAKSLNLNYFVAFTIVASLPWKCWEIPVHITEDKILFLQTKNGIMTVTVIDEWPWCRRKL